MKLKGITVGTYISPRPYLSNFKRTQENCKTLKEY